jgi:hypothetical protein
MKKLIVVLGLLVSGCAYKGDVQIYSPSGSENMIEKGVNAKAELDMPMIP